MAAPYCAAWTARQVGELPGQAGQSKPPSASYWPLFSAVSPDVRKAARSSVRT